MTAAVALAAEDPSPSGAVLSVRRSDDAVVEIPIDDAGTDLLANAQPWRTFRWYHGQRHYSGMYWSATESGHVIYESRLELAGLLYADFDRTVHRIVAQPFLLQADVAGIRRRHVPDYLLVTTSGLTIVNVKPAALLDDPKVSAALRWAREVIEGVGWQYKIFTEPPDVEFANIRFLAGYRLPVRISPLALGEMRSRNLDGMTFAAAVAESESAAARARAALLHMLWRQELSFDLTESLSARTQLFEARP